MADLQDLLVTAKPPEKSGASSANRADFQKDWALCHLLELHSSGKDYRLLLEHHDDVAVLDSADAPTRVHFYQVKTASKAWTLAILTSRRTGKKGLKPSMLGKLLHHVATFGSAVGSLNFVTNTCFDITLADGSSGLTRTCTSISELCEANKKHLRTKLSKELSLAPPLPGESTTYLLRSDLSELGHSAGALGKLVAFLEQFGNPGTSAGTIYRALYDEIRRRSTDESTWKALADLHKIKSICRVEFEEMLHRATSTVAERSKSGWERCLAQLQNEKVPWRRQVLLQTAWRRYEADRLNPTNLPAQKLRAELTQRIPEHFAKSETASLMEFASSILVGASRPPAYSDDEYLAAALLEAHSYGQESAVQAPSAKPKEADV